MSSKAAKKPTTGNHPSFNEMITVSSSICVVFLHTLPLPLVSSAGSAPSLGVSGRSSSLIEVDSGLPSHLLTRVSIISAPFSSLFSLYRCPLRLPYLLVALYLSPSSSSSTYSIGKAATPLSGTIIGPVSSCRESRVNRSHLLLISPSHCLHALHVP
jgi:hypothetical protein